MIDKFLEKVKTQQTVSRWTHSTHYNTNVNPV